MWRSARLPQHLYLFHHVGKCAGTSLVETFGQLGREGICLGFPCETKHQVRRAARQELVQRRLSPKRLKIFYGHRVYFGLHHLAPQPARYFTFLRHPVSRVISLYNYHCDIAQNPAHQHHERDRRLMMRGEQRISFAEWFERLYTGNHLVRFLSYAMDEDRVHVPEGMEPQHLVSAKAFLDRCWFIGFTESSKQDIPLVCQAVGVPAPEKRSNVSKQHLSEAERVLASKLVEGRDQLDMELYDYARKLRGN